MIIKNLRKFVVILAGSPFLFTSCMDDFDSKKGSIPGNTISPELKNFAFATRGNAKLSVNYNAPGYKALISVYKENPLDADGNLKEGISSIYSAFTDDYGKYEGTMYIPTAVTEAYLYTERWGLPHCVKLKNTEEGFSFDMSSPQQKATRAGGYELPSLSDLGTRRSDGLYSLCKYDVNGTPTSNGYITLDHQIGLSNELPGVIQKRVMDYLVAENPVSKIASPEVLNIKTTEGMEAKLTFLGEAAANYNTFGYYYYKNDSPISYSNFYSASKFAVFPNVTNDGGSQVLKPGSTVQLLYFDENGKASTKFPAGYTIGWFLISDGFKSPYGGYNGTIKSIESIAYSSPSLYSLRNTCFSNEVIAGSFDARQFITVKDAKSGLYVIGIEDEGLNGKGTKDDYADMLFSVTTTPSSVDPELPVVPDPDPSEGEESEIEIAGTLAFEDIWPWGGDYDMNDVAVEYKRTIKFDENNNATTVEEYFKFIQEPGAATLDNYFAYQVENMGTILEQPTNCTAETETNSIVFTTSAKNTCGKEFTIKRKISGTVSQDDIAKDFNPYIMAGSMETGRKEVHLPTYKATIKADQKAAGTGEDAYYMKKDGQYPFAIDIATAGFVLSKETKPIDFTYLRFATWCKSFGKTDKDWYLDTPSKP